MSDTFKTTIWANQSEKQIVFNPIVCLSDVSFSESTPYDFFVSELTEYIKRSRAADSEQIRLLLLGLMSSTEMFFRTTLAGCARICPSASKKVNEGQVPVSAVKYYPAEKIAFALLEHASFADAETIRKQTKAITDLEIPKNANDSIAGALDEFDKVCVLRHAIIHSAGIVSGKNIFDLNVEPTQLMSVRLSEQVFETIAEVCLNVVKAFNNFLFSALLNRYIKKSSLSIKWENDEVFFNGLYSLFISEEIRKTHKNVQSLFDAVNAELQFYTTKSS